MCQSKTKCSEYKHSVFLAIGSSTAMQLKLLIVKTLRDSLLSSYCKYYGSGAKLGWILSPRWLFYSIYKEGIVKDVYSSLADVLTVCQLYWMNLPYQTAFARTSQAKFGLLTEDKIFTWATLQNYCFFAFVF